MLPSLGFTEILLIAVLAIIVVGPADMPKMMRTVGRYVGKIKAMGQEFKDAFDEMGRQSEIAELRAEIDELKKSGRISNLTEEAFNEDLMELDTELRESTSMSHPRQAAKPQPNDGGPDGET